MQLLPVMAFAQPGASYCVRQHYAQLKREGPVLGIDASEAAKLVQQISQSIGLLHGPTVIACDVAEKAFAWPSKGDIDGVPKGEYIVYSPDWVREVIGKDRVQAIALFGHELGHFVNRHFEASPDNVTRRTQEQQADHFAGCAVARLHGDFQSLEHLLSRLRREKADLYPDRLTSVESAREGFQICKDTQPVPRARWYVQMVERSGVLSDILPTTEQALSRDQGLRHYFDIGLLPAGVVVPTFGLLDAVRKGTLTATVVRGPSAPSARDLKILSCGKNEWLAINAEAWSRWPEISIAKLANFCTSRQ